MAQNRAQLLAFTALAVVAACGIPAAQAQSANPQSWLDPTLSPDERATLVEQQFTQAELLGIVHGSYAVPANYMMPANVVPPGAIGSAGYVPGAPELSIPALQESDAGTGVGPAGGGAAPALPPGPVRPAPHRGAPPAWPALTSNMPPWLTMATKLRSAAEAGSAAWAEGSEAASAASRAKRPVMRSLRPGA